jgi:predicted metal-binding protein
MALSDANMSVTGVTVFVCVSCGAQPDGGPALGHQLYDSVTARISAEMAGAITVTPLECLAVCKRPCTIALSGSGKWTCVVGDLDPEQHAGDVIAAARSYMAAQNGIIPWRQRPLSFRKGVVARVPPLGFRPESFDV